MPDLRSESGFTIVELLVGIALFAAISIGFYQVLFATQSAATTTQSAARVSEEARLGLNRLVRDTREASTLTAPTPTSYKIENDFNGDGVLTAAPADPAGDYEVLTVAWDSVARTVTLSNGVSTEVLMRDVDCIRRASDNTCHDVFQYTSSHLEYDTSGDGVTSVTELDQSPSVGNNDGLLNGVEPDFIDAVRFSFRVEKGGRSANFYAEAQMRNFR